MYQNNGYQQNGYQQGGYPPRNGYNSYGNSNNINININNVSTNAQEGGSYFDGGLLQQIGWRLLGGLLTLFTLGIGLPWAVCMLYRWETKHTVIDGHRLGFNGTGGQLLGKWLLWMLLTIITIGIYGFWVSIKLKKWITKHTYLAN